MTAPSSVPDRSPRAAVLQTYGVIYHDETCHHDKQMKFVALSAQTCVSFEGLVMNTWQTETQEVKTALSSGP